MALIKDYLDKFRLFIFDLAQDEEEEDDFSDFVGEEKKWYYNPLSTKLYYLFEKDANEKLQRGEIVSIHNH